MTNIFGSMTIAFLLLLQGIGGKPGGIGGAGGGVGGGYTPTPTATFTHIQGNGCFSLSTCTNVTSTSFTHTLPGGPTTGNAEICYVWTYNNGVSSPPTVTVVDGASNSYSKSPNSPSAYQAAGFGYLFYLLNAPGGASSTLNVSFSSSTGTYASIQCDEFSRSSGTWAFDSDAAGITPTTPIITVTGANDVLYAGAINDGNHNPTVTSPWTANSAGIISNTTTAGYYINVTTSTAVNFNSGTAGNTSTMGMSLK